MKLIEEYNDVAQLWIVGESLQRLQPFLLGPNSLIVPSSI